MASLPGKNATSTDRQRCPVGGLHNLIRSVVELRRGLPGPGAAQVLVGHLQLVNPLVQRDELFSPGQFAAWPSMVRVVCVLGHEVSTRPRTTSAPASSHGPRQITAVGLPSRKVRWANATVVPSVRSLSALATPPGRTSAPVVQRVRVPHRAVHVESLGACTARSERLPWRTAARGGARQVQSSFEIRACGQGAKADAVCCQCPVPPSWRSMTHSASLTSAPGSRSWPTNRDLTA